MKFVIQSATLCAWCMYEELCLCSNPGYESLGPRPGPGVGGRGGGEGGGGGGGENGGQV